MQHNKHIEQIIALALAEDIGTGDVTTESVVAPGRQITGKLLAKEAGVLCGLDIARRVFASLDGKIVFRAFFRDGDRLEAGALIAGISGPAAGILSGERVALNFLQRLSGIATKTARLAESIEGSGAILVDTRKTSPGMRVLEKYAVKTGGGHNHRMNLSDGILIKDNHIRAGGGIKKAVEAARMHAPLTIRVEVETESLEEVTEALEAGADIIMLDNMDLQTMRTAVEMIGKRALVEASGNMDRRDLRAVAATGVDMISLGALTHSVKALDISLKFVSTAAG